MLLLKRLAPLEAFIFHRRVLHSKKVFPMHFGKKRNTVSKLSLKARGKPMDQITPDFKWVVLELLVKLQGNGSKSFTRTELFAYRERQIRFFIKAWRLTVGTDFYPLFRLLLPQRDSRQYNLKEATLISAVCSVMGLPKKSELELSLLNRKKGTKESKLSVILANEFLKRKLTNEKGSQITVNQVNEKLDELSSRALGHRFGYQSLSKDPAFLFFVRNMSSVEIGYLFDILLKYRVLSSTLEKKLLNAFHPQAELYLSVVSDLKSLCETLADPSKKLNSQSAELQLAVGNAFAPHLCKKIDNFKEILAKMGEGGFFIEEKLDGERMQVHYLNYGSDIRFYSRNSLDNSFLYGTSTQTGIISQFIKLHKNVRNCILDGEMVTVDVKTGDILPFGVVKSAARKEIMAERAFSTIKENAVHAVHADEEDSSQSLQTSEAIESINKEYRPLFVVFDVVLVNDISFEEYPLSKRKDYLQNILAPFPGRVEINKYYEASTEQDIKEALDHAIRVDAEGVIIKNKASSYKIGARNDTWIKVKPEYLQYFGEEMDLLVMGKIPQKKPAYICGFRISCKDTKSKSDESILSNDSFDDSEKYTYISFCKIANGISQYEDELISAKTKNKWIEYKYEKPSMLTFGTEKPVLWIRPEDSFVLEIKGRSINYSEQSAKKFKAASTLTGGYCRSVRFDKSYKSCATFASFLDSRKGSKAQDNNPLSKEFQKNKRKSGAVRRKIGLLETEHIPKKLKLDDYLFQGLEFYVLTDYFPDEGSKLPKALICQQIILHGGKVINNVKPNASNLRVRILSSKRTYECAYWIKKNYDILNISWVLDCIKCKRLLNLEPQYCFSVSRSLYKKSLKMIDKYGDSRQSQTDEEMLANIIQYYDMKAPSLCDRKKYRSEFQELSTLPLLLFSGIKFYVAATSTPAALVLYLQNLIKMFGGELITEMDHADIILIAFGPNKKCYSANTIEKAQNCVTQLLYRTDSTIGGKIPVVLKSEWLVKSVDAMFLQDQSRFKVTDKDK